MKSDASTRVLPLPVTDAGKGAESPQLILHVSIYLCGEKTQKKVRNTKATIRVCDLRPLKE